MHILPITLLLVDYFTNHWKFVYSHIIFTILWMIVYGCFNCAYTLGTGNPIYKDVLEWNNFMTYVYCVAMIVMVTVFHILLTFIGNKKAADRDKLLSTASTVTERLSKSIKKKVDNDGQEA